MFTPKPTKLVVSLAVSMVLAGCSSESPPAVTVTKSVTIATPAAPALPPTTAAAPIAGIGQEARDDGLAFIVTKVRPLSGEMAGKGFAVLMTVKNIGNSARTYAAADQKLIDSDGREFSVDTDELIKDSYEPEAVLRADINPGMQLDVGVPFDMPPNAQPARVLLHESTYSHGVIVNLT